MFNRKVKLTKAIIVEILQQTADKTNEASALSFYNESNYKKQRMFMKILFIIQKAIKEIWEVFDEEEQKPN